MSDNFTAQTIGHDVDSHSYVTKLFLSAAAAAAAAAGGAVIQCCSSLI